MSSFCSSKFWDYNLTWNSTDPDFTDCFEKTVLAWVPCAFFWLCLPWEISLLRRTQVVVFKSIDFRDILKLAIIVLLVATNLFDVIAYIFTDRICASVNLYTPLIKLLTFSTFLYLNLTNMKRGRNLTGTRSVFPISLAFCGLAQFRTELKSFYQIVDMELLRATISYLIYYLLVLILLFVNLFIGPARSEWTSLDRQDPNNNPEADASIWSKIFFIRLEKLLWVGYKRPLTEDDLWDLDEKMRTANIVQTFQSCWQRDVQRSRNEKMAADTYSLEKLPLIQERFPAREWRTKDVSIVWPLFEVCGYGFLFGCLLRLIYMSMSFTTPVLLSLILEFIDDENDLTWHGYFYTLLMIMNSFVLALLFAGHHYVAGQVEIQAQTVIMSVAYRKALKISNGTRKDFAYGEISNIMAVDVQTFSWFVSNFAIIICFPIEVVISFYGLWKILGPSALVGMVMMIIFAWINSRIIVNIRTQQTNKMKRKDKRNKLTHEILSGIRVLKLYACEPNFGKRITDFREEEFKILKFMSYLQSGISVMANCATFFISLVSFGLYIFMNEEHSLNIQVAFVSLSWLKILQTGFQVLPTCISGVIAALVAIKRINKFLNAEELDPNAVSHEQRPEPVIIKRGTFSWESPTGPPILRNINMEVQPGSLVAIVGSIGAGKSSLLSAIFGELYKQSGFVNTTNRIAYVPQQAWIRNDTLENNITLGETTDRTFYETILEACALIPDLEILSDGDQTEIGEKGVTLSGGQKQRVSLARALFSKADTYLLDDPLSAVDVHVGKSIFEKVIGPKGFLKEKTRVFVTHNLVHLRDVDYVVVLKNGTISESGTYQEFLNSGTDFAKFVASHLENNDEKNGRQEDHDARKMSSFPPENVEVQSLNRKTKVSKWESEEKTTIDSKRHTLVEKEELKTSNIESNVLTYYLRAMGKTAVIGTFVWNALYQIFFIATDYCLSIWSSVDGRGGLSEQVKYLGFYALIGFSQAFSVAFRTIVLYMGMLGAAKYLHNSLLDSILHWPISTFDRIPCGRILNRLGADIFVLDDDMPRNTLDMITNSATLISAILIISFNIPQFTLVIIIIFITFFYIQRIYSASVRQTRRMESLAKSKIYSYFDDTISGASSIRAYNMQSKFIEGCNKKIEDNQKIAFLRSQILGWLVQRMEFGSSFLTSSAFLFGVQAKYTLSASLIALCLNNASGMSRYVSLLLRKTTEFEANIVSIERVKEYIEMEQEAPWVLPTTDRDIPRNWPDEGHIVFKNFQLRYHKDLDPVLKEVNFSVKGSEKIGVVGRTGAGKSSLTLSLFRVIESSIGSIFIDNIDISKIGLHTLRSKLTVIPQDPIVFSGTLRTNLDPSDKFSDEQIWRVLELVSLKTYVSSLEGGLQYEVGEQGSNFSIGQRQLICLARALIKKTKILILDEATASIDLKTDDLIQATIRQEFVDSTVLTVAHRLSTVMDYDRIMVLDRGRVAEFDSPQNLLRIKDSIFYHMALESGLAQKSNEK